MPLGRVVGMHPQALGIQLVHPQVVVVDAVAAALRVPADELEGILFRQGVVGALRRVHVPGDGGHKVPVLRPVDLFREDLHLAAGGGEGILLRVPALLLEGDDIRVILVAVDARLLEHLIIRQLRLPFPQVVIAVLQPLAESAPLRKLGTETDLLRHLAEPVILEAALVQGFNDLVVKAQEVAVLPGDHDVLSFKKGDARQQDVGDFGAGGHEKIAAQNEFALGGVRQNLLGAVDVPVLVDEAVARQVHHHFDVALQMLAPGDAVQGCHLVAPEDGFRPQVGGNGHAVGI